MSIPFSLSIAANLPILAAKLHKKGQITKYLFFLLPHVEKFSFYLAFSDKLRIFAPRLNKETMLTPYKIEDYCKEYKPTWTIKMPDGCPPEDVLVPLEHPFFRLAKQPDTFSADDFKSYAEAGPVRNWGALLPLAVGLSIIDNEKKARKNLKLPMFRQFKGIIALVLNPMDGVVKQTGLHRSHFTWW